MIKVRDLKRFGIDVIEGDLSSGGDYFTSYSAKGAKESEFFNDVEISEFAWRKNTGVKPDFDGEIELNHHDSSFSEITLASKVGWKFNFYWKPCMKSLMERVNAGDTEQQKAVKVESSGGACDYYRVLIACPYTDEQDPYIAECGDIMEALKLTYNEAQEFKEIWRTAAARTLGKVKEGNNEKRAAEKRVFFASQDLKRITKLGK